MSEIANEMYEILKNAGIEGEEDEYIIWTRKITELIKKTITNRI